MQTKFHEHGNGALGPTEVCKQAVPKGNQIKNDLFPQMCVAWLVVDLIDAAPVNGGAILGHGSGGAVLSRAA